MYCRPRVSCLINFITETIQVTNGPTSMAHTLDSIGLTLISFSHKLLE